MEQYAPIMALMAGGLGLLFVGIAIVALSMRRLRRREKLWCPVHQVSFEVKDLRTVPIGHEAGHPVDVMACEPFGEGPLTCDKACLRGATVFQIRQEKAGARSARKLPVVPSS